MKTLSRFKQIKVLYVAMCKEGEHVKGEPGNTGTQLNKCYDVPTSK